MSIISLTTSNTSATISSDSEDCRNQTPSENSYDEKNNSSSHISSQYALTDSKNSVIALGDAELKNMLTKLNVAKIHITPLVDIILQAASFCSEVEFKQIIRTNEPVCSISKKQYIRAFTAAQILRDVRLELQPYQKPNSELYSMNTKNSIIVNSTINDLLNNANLAGTDTIYIDRDTMRQLLELHELVTETIVKLQGAEHIKKEALVMSCPDAPNRDTKDSKETQHCPEKSCERDNVPQKSSCCLQFLEANKLNKCICTKQQNSKYLEKAIDPAVNMSQDISQNDTNIQQENCCAAKLLKTEQLGCKCHKDGITINHQKDTEPPINLPQEETPPIPRKDASPENLISEEPTKLIKMTEEKNEELTPTKQTVPKEQSSAEIKTESTNKIAAPLAAESIDNFPKILNTGMLPNEKQLTISPSDTVLRDFAAMGSNTTQKSSARKSSQRIAPAKSIEKNSEVGRKISKSKSPNAKNERSKSLDNKDKKIKKEVINNNKSKNTKKISKELKGEINKQDQEIINSDHKNIKKKSTTSFNMNSTDIKSDKDENVPLLEKQNNINSKDPHKLNDLKTNATEKESVKSVVGALPKDDNKLTNNETTSESLQESDKKIQKKKSNTQGELKPNLSNKKMPQTEVSVHLLADLKATNASSAAGENVTQPKIMIKRAMNIKNSVKNNENVNKNKQKGRIEEGFNKSGTGNRRDMKKKISRKNLENNDKNATADILGELYPSQSSATIMQAPSIHIKTDLVTHKKFLQTNSNYRGMPNNTSKVKIALRPINFSTSPNKEIKKPLDPTRTAFMQKKKDTDNNTKIPDANESFAIDSKKNFRSLSSQVSFTHRVDETTMKKTLESPRITESTKDSFTTKQSNESKKEALVTKQNECQRGNELEKTETNQSFIQKTKTKSRELFSTILKGVTPIAQDCQNNTKFSPIEKDKYESIADAKAALLQCLDELTKIRSYINDCDDPELRTLEQAFNVQIFKHNKNCGVNEAPHVHCNLQGVELTLKTDKDLYSLNCPENVIISKKDASSSTHQSFVRTPINSNNNIVLRTSISNPSGRHTQTSASDTAKNVLSIDAQTEDTMSLPAETTKESESTEQVEDFYDMFNPNSTSSYIEPNDKPTKEKSDTVKNPSKSMKNQGSTAGIPYVVGIKSLPKLDGAANASKSMVISVASMKKFMDTEEIHHTDEDVNRALKSIHINHLLASCTPVACSVKTSLNDRRDIPSLPLKPSLTSLPLSTTDLVVIRQNIERKSNNAMSDKLLLMSKTIYNCNTFEYYTNFQANFSSNRDYFVPKVYLVYYFEARRNDEGGDSDSNGKLPPKRRTHLTAISTQQEDEADSEPEGKWSDFKLFDYIRKEFSSLRGDGPAPKTSNSLNIKTLKGSRNKKIQVSLTKTIEIPVKSKRRGSRSRILDNRETSSQATQSCVEAIASQTASSYTLPDNQINHQANLQKHRTLHTQTTNQSSTTNSLANILLDTIYETEFENPLQNSVQQVYNLPNILNTPTSILEQLQSLPKTPKQKLIVETNQYEINDSLKPNSSRMSNTNLYKPSSKLKNNEKYTYQSFIPRPKTSITNAINKDKSSSERDILRTNVSITGINKRSANSCNNFEKKQTPSNSRTSILPRSPTRERFAPLTESSSECEDSHAGSSKICASNFSQSKLIASSPKRATTQNRRNIVRDKIKNLPIYSSQSLNATLRRQQSFASSEMGMHHPSQVMFGCGSDHNTSITPSIFNLPKKHSCGFLSVLSPTCGCPDVTVFIPCYCCDKNSSGRGKSSGNTESLDILNKGVSGMYHVIMPPVHNSSKRRN